MLNVDKWKPQVITDSKVCPFLIIDNWFSENEFNNVFKEVDFLFSGRNIDRAENNKDSAKYSDGGPKVLANRIYYEEIYNNTYDNKFTHIPITIDKIRTDKFKTLLKETYPLQSRVFFSSAKSSAILTYYENNDKYDTHYDNALFTILIWLYKEPKKFEGGDLKLTDINKTIKCVNNRMVIFPSYYEHAVLPIKMNNKDKGYGRYTISHFFNFTGFN